MYRQMIMGTITNRHNASGQARLKKVSVFVGLAVLAGLMLAIPFVFPTMTLWYKFGTDRLMLQAAQMLGLLALLLICLQLVAAVRPAFLAGLFGPAALLRAHRTNGVAILVCVLGHILLVLAPEGFANLPWGRKHWPELVGALLFGLLLFMVASSRFREPLGLDYRRWRDLHRPLGYTGLVLAAIHVRFVSDSFHQGLPMWGLYLLMLAVVTLIGLAKWRGSATGQPGR